MTSPFGALEPHETPILDTSETEPFHAPVAAPATAGRAERRRRDAGRTRRRRAAVVALASGLLLTPLASTVMHLASPSHVTRQPVRTVTTTARVVVTGERVQVTADTQLWLARNGAYCSGPQLTEFRAVGETTSRPDVLGLQAQSGKEGFSLWGVYWGKGDAARVDVVTGQGRVTGTVVKLPGRHNWGAWYAVGSVPQTSASKARWTSIRGITIYDAKGHTIASRSTPGK